ncbi:hypothetical protein Fmac_023991 [Flemingia macrophylla]|uniref:AAA+ ATPase domain-containing protein n=1 Tax=Flemingia macrophylla TaxID=520843 RepID=A0ABD1LNM0_9FABA
MEDILISVAAKIVEYTVSPVFHQAQYICCFKDFVEKFQNVKRELESTQENVKERVKEATNRIEEIQPTVEKWLKDVENVLKEVQETEKKILEISESCFKKRCKYFLAKKIEREIENMTRLKRDSNFELFSRIIELPGMKYYSSKNFVLFKSIEQIYNELLEALKDNSVCMIGLVGMGGSGKTTLAKEVGKKVEEFKIFDKVVMVIVSETPKIRSIQDEIAEKLDFKLEKESDDVRAQRLSQRLSIGTTLIILDDVWEKLDFEVLGIPLNENNKGCRVLITTRKIEVCTSMQCQSIIELKILTNEEAWTLFTSHAEIVDESPYALKVVARQIVNECKGLPIAIVTVGSTLRGKSIVEWKSALSRLKDSKPLAIPKGVRSPHACLQLSYNNLTDILARSLFLLCSVFPEDHEIDLENLFRFGWGRGLFKTFGTMEKARKELCVAINTLKGSCLLLHVDDYRVKMHDMLRDVALCITFEMNEPILASNVVDPRILVEDDTIKDKRVISLWDLKNGQLLNDDHFNISSTLEILVLQSHNDHLELSSVFQRLKMLKILALFTQDDYTWYLRYPLRTLSLPYSMGSLKNLRTLCLRGYKLGNIFILESLQTLEIIDLRGSSFEELPNGIIALKKLKLLDLCICEIEKNNPYEVIGRCLQLEELHLGIESPYIMGVWPNSFFSRLKRYFISTKTDLDPRYFTVDILSKHRPSRALYMNSLDVLAKMNDLFLRAEYLYLQNLQGGYKNIIPSMDPKGMSQLMFLILQDCGEIECLFDNVDMLETELVFSSLVILGLDNLYNLQEVFRDPSSQCFLKDLQVMRIINCQQLYNISFPRNSKLCKLKEIIIRNCPKLTCLFTPSVSQTLDLLEVLKIYGCSELKHIIEEVSSPNHTSLPLSKLRTLEIVNCDRLEYLFPICLAPALTSLDNLEISDNHKLKYVYGSEKEHNISVQTNIHINWPNLDYVCLRSLPDLIAICPEDSRPYLPKLAWLELVKCPRLSNFSVQKTVIDLDLQDTKTMEKEIPWLLFAAKLDHLCDQMLCAELQNFYLIELGVEGLFQFQMGELGSNKKLLVPLNLSLTVVHLESLPHLKFIWNGPTNFLNLQLLGSVRVHDCPKLKTIFSPTVVRSLPMLRWLFISNCEELEQIFDSGDVQELKSLYTCSQQKCFPKLDVIRVERCNKLKFLFYNFVAGHFSGLRILVVEECSQLEKVFAFECEIDGDGQEGTDMDEGQVPLENLEIIILSSFPNFKEIHHQFKLKDHVQQIIKDCPKYSPSLYLYPDM